MITPGPRDVHEDGRHAVPSFRLATSNGYRIPLGIGALKQTLREIRPEFVFLHDPFWRPHGVTQLAHDLGARVIAVHHASPALGAAAIPGPDALYKPLLRWVYHHAYKDVDAVMSVVDSKRDGGRAASIPLRFGLDPAFRPAPATRGEQLLYVGRLSFEKRIEDLLAAAKQLDRDVRVIGEGPAYRALELRAGRTGIRGRVHFEPFVGDRPRLAQLYREAACVVDPGPHETFGLVVFEAAASGARVAACDTTPSTRVADGLIETFTPADVDDLVRAVGRAIGRDDRTAVAEALAERSTWERVFATEVEELRRLPGG
jgi:alpha-1,6-mannosyltransferase